MAKNNNQTATRNKCQKYEKAITHFVIGEEMGMTKEELFEHLKVCKPCRQELTQWQDTYQVMRTEAFARTPEGKAKMQKDLTGLKEMMKRQPLPPQVKDTITIQKIDEGAGKVWQTLGKYGPVELPELPEKANLDPYLALLSTGWLAGERKVDFDPNKIPPNVVLTKNEQARFRRQNNVQL